VMVDQAEVEKAAAILLSGGLVVFPTETVYGLGANALDPLAVRRIFQLKGRPATSPLIVHVGSVEQAKELAAEWPEAAERLAREYWPGPLTLVVPKRFIVPDEVTAGLPSVGLRVPRHPVALALLTAAGVPIAAPSANRFTKLSPTTAQHVRDAFGDQTPFLLDGGPCEVGIESTVIAVSKDSLEVLRPGMARVENALSPQQPTSAQESSGVAHRAPGQHPKHYSPRTRILLVSDGHLPADGAGGYLYLQIEAKARVVRQMPSHPRAYAARLYATLHELDELELAWIAIEMPPPTAEWAAIRDRLTRAAY
jgi:L-threonylcarbamoyladenylate synthase